MSRLICVSNRTAADPSARAGGLAVAVWEALQATGGLWVGWSGDIADEVGPPRRLSDEGVDFLLTDMTAAEHEGFYTQTANSAIWPVFHYRIDLSHFDAEAFATYAEVNARMAQLVASAARPGDQVWVHDYHFLLMARTLREAGVAAPLGFFLHIPFPSPEIFQALPQHETIAQALACYDLIGLQSETDAANLTRYFLESCGGRMAGDGVIEVFGHLTRVAAYPIGIDPEAFATAATSAKAEEAATRIGRFLGGRQLVLGVDRMDYSKGLPERFLAVGRFFDDHPEMHGVVSVTQIAPTSRETVEEYRALRIELDELAGRINGDYGDLDWIPLRYLVRPYMREELAGLYRIARVGLITPLRDGMNLVCKEYVAAQDPADPGVLILSEFAGAAEQLQSALLVNPHDAGRVAEAIHRALTMPLAERQARWQAARDVIWQQDIGWWRRRFLEDLAAIGPERRKAG